MLWRWEHGRQGGGYSKLMLAVSKRLRFDCYLIRLPTGSRVNWHNDPAPEGFEHHRINITLRRPRVSGLTLIYDLEGKRPRIEERQVYRFRPDVQRHRVTPIKEGELLLLSIGWLRRSRK